MNLLKTTTTTSKANTSSIITSFETSTSTSSLMGNSASANTTQITPAQPALSSTTNGLSSTSNAASNFSQVSATSTLTTTLEPIPNSNKSNSKPTLLTLPTPAPPSSAPISPSGLNSSLTTQMNSHNTCVLPSLNISAQQQSLRSSSNLNFNLIGPTTINSNNNVKSLFKTNGGAAIHATSQFSLANKQNSKDYRSTLNDAKTFLDTENNQLKLPMEPPKNNGRLSYYIFLKVIEVRSV